MKRVSFFTFGCRLNQSETAVIQNGLESRGFKVVGFDEAADIVVVNTCTVTEGGDADTRRLVYKINRDHPNARIALVGCQAQVQKQALADLPQVKWVIGNAQKMELGKVFDQYPDPQQTAVIAPTIDRTPFVQLESATDRQHKRANLKIQDGCDFFCSFCEIPYARGRARSRVFSDILREAQELAGSGHQEMVLTGINIGTYQFETKTLLDVIDALELIDGIKRIRISSIEPTTLPIDLIKRMGKSKLCRYLHLPLQAGSDAVLSAMKRKYTADEYRRFVEEAKALVPEICIGTDIIVGFPGETDAQFEETLTALREWPIDYAHVFSYSPRHMAKSRLADDVVQSSIITKRSQLLRDMSARKRLVFQQALLGSVQEVLFESQKNGLWSGLTDHYVRVKITHHDDLTNKLKRVKLTVAGSQFVQGEIVND